MSKIFIQHRINSIAELSHCKSAYGVEIDLRSDLSQGGQLHIAHDAGIHGPLFCDWLKEYKKRQITGPLLVNTKEDLLEEKAIAELDQVQIKNYLFLDTAPPTLFRWVKNGKGKYFFLRHSAHEPLEAILPFQGKIDWVWVDCLEGKPMPLAGVNRLKQAGFKLCLVSPELQNQELAQKISEFQDLYKIADAVCTKKPEIWQKHLGD
jgi:hypothetical protein